MEIIAVPAILESEFIPSGNVCPVLNHNVTMYLSLPIIRIILTMIIELLLDAECSHILNELSGDLSQ